MLLFILSLFVFQDAKPEKQQDPKEAFKRIVADFDKTYRKCIARSNACKTTADRQDAANENLNEMTEWVRKHNNTKIEIDCVFVDINRTDAGFGASFAVTDKSIQMFAPAFKKPVVSKTFIGLTVDPDTRDVLQKGMKATISAELRCDLFFTPFETSSPTRQFPEPSQTLFSIFLRTGDRPPVPYFSKDNERQDYAISYVMHDLQMTIDPDDLKKAKKK
jgi:hypothetical protein